jgi:hypothetical protein
MNLPKQVERNHNESNPGRSRLESQHMNQIIVFAIHILLKMVQELLKVIKDLTGFLLSQTISITAFQI